VNIEWNRKVLDVIEREIDAEVRTRFPRGCLHLVVRHRGLDLVASPRRPANASYLPIAIMSGIFDPTFSVPGWLSSVVAVLPVRALAQINVVSSRTDPGSTRLARLLRAAG
jgi:hypothetical protein